MENAAVFIPDHFVAYGNIGLHSKTYHKNKYTYRITFPNVSINIGHNYCKETGIYLCSQKGIYVSILDLVLYVGNTVHVPELFLIPKGQQKMRSSLALIDTNTVHYNGVFYSKNNKNDNIYLRLKLKDPSIKINSINSERNCFSITQVKDNN
jgi:hypothetical protein